MSLSRPVFCVSAPRTRRVTRRDIKSAIEHATNLCYNFEDTPECRSAWETVDELSMAMNHQFEKIDENNKIKNWTHDINKSIDR